MDVKRAEKLLDQIGRFHEVAMNSKVRSMWTTGTTATSAKERERSQKNEEKMFDAIAELRTLITGVAPTQEG